MTNKTTLPAEWEGRKAILLSWPHPDTDWAYMLDAVTECYINVVREFTRVARVIIEAPDISYVANKLRGFVDLSKVLMVEMPTDDTWARDFGPIYTISDDGEWIAQDFKFNGWGLKFASSRDNLTTTHLMHSGIIKSGYRNRLSFVLEGGSIDCDGHGSLLTTSECLLSPNRNGADTRDEIEDVLKEAFGAQQVVWLEHGALEGDDTDSHIDTLARFLPGNKIAYTICDVAEDAHYSCLKSMECELQKMIDTEGHPYELIPLPIPKAIFDSEGQRLPATYANFLIVNDTLFVPIYGDAHYDAIAIQRLKEAVPEYTIVPIDCRALIEQHGSLHCITMQIPEEVITL